MTLDTAPAGPGRFRLAVGAPDQAGALATVAGLLTARGLDIERGRVRTVAEAGGGRISDEFMVRADGPPPGGWDGLRDDLAALFGLLASGGLDAARERLVEWMAAGLPAGGPSARAALAPVDVEIDNDAPDRTVLHIETQDTPGFLFEFASALTALGIDIVEVEIDTDGGHVHDTFRVTDARGRKVVSPARLDELRYAAVLIKQFTHLLPTAPDPNLALRQFGRLTQHMLAHKDWAGGLHALERGEVLASLVQLLGASEYLWEDFLRLQHENLFPVVSDVPGLDQRKDVAELRRALAADLAASDAADAAARREALNRFKDREMFRIDLRHITGRVDLSAFAEELSDLADAVVEGATGLAAAQRPTPAPGAWAVLALGKHGGREMGFASDVELLFVHATPHADAWHEELVRAVLATLGARPGGTFEPDLRLRPHGRDGPLATTVDRFARYFGPGGGAAQHERMALVRMRPVTGDPGLAAEVLAARDACLCGGARIDTSEVRRVRARQVAELVPPGTVNVKYSPGGIVDVEYHVQTLQIGAWRDVPAVRVAGTMEAIARLEAAGRVDARSADRLRAAWTLLRRVIDGLRIVRGRARDLTLPAPDGADFRRLARRLGAASAPDLSAALADARAWVSTLPVCPA